MAERRYSTQIDIQAPVTRVWEIMSDVGRWPDWTPSISEVQRLDEGPFAVGSRARIRQPRLRPATWTVETLDPGAGFTWSTSTPGARIVGDHRIVTGAGSDTGPVTVELTVTTTGPLAGLAHVLYGRTTQRYIETEATGLKAECEG